MQGSRKFILLQLIVRLAITIGDEKRMNKYLDQLLKEDQSCSAKLHRLYIYDI
jgi:hypothetical protein